MAGTARRCRGSLVEVDCRFAPRRTAVKFQVDDSIAGTARHSFDLNGLLMSLDGTL